MARNDLRKGRIPERATTHGDFVMDIGGQIDCVTANDLLGVQDNLRLFKSNKLFPVFDAKNGSSIGNMTARDFLRKML